MGSYAKQTWADTSAGGTPITGARLTVMEQGIEDAHRQFDLPGGFVTVANGAPAAVGTRRAAFMFGCGGQEIRTDYNTGHFRTAFRVPVKTTRWRLRISNKDPGGASSTSAINATGLWTGKNFAHLETGQPTTWFDGSNYSQTIPAFTIPANGAEYVSSWVTAAGSQFDPITPYMMSMGWSKVTAGSQIYCGSSGGWTTTVAADASVSAPNGVAVGFIPFAAQIEYEFVGNNRVFLAIGDSLTEGFGAALPMNTWHQRASIRLGIPFAMTADFGALTTDYGNAAMTVPRWQRIVDAGLTLDGAIIHLGTNDASTSVAGATYQAAMHNTYAKLRGAPLNVRDIYYSTIAPRTLTGTPETTRTNYNAWLLESDAYRAGVFDFCEAVENGMGNTALRPTYAFDATHWNTRGHTKVGHAVLL